MNTLIGGGDHDYSWRTQPKVEDYYMMRGGPLVESNLIGGDGHDNWQ